MNYKCLGTVNYTKDKSSFNKETCVQSVIYQGYYNKDGKAPYDDEHRF